MAQVLYHAYCPQFTLAASSTTLPAFFVGQTDTNHGLQLKKFRIGMAGTGGASVTYQVFASGSTAATAAGTSTAGTIVQVAGRSITAGGITVCGYNYTAARTTETYVVVDTDTVANNGTIIYDSQPGDEPDCGVGVATFGAGFGVFLSAGTPVATTIDMWFTRI